MSFHLPATIIPPKVILQHLVEAKFNLTDDQKTSLVLLWPLNLSKYSCVFIMWLYKESVSLCILPFTRWEFTLCSLNSIGVIVAVHRLSIGHYATNTCCWCLVFFSPIHSTCAWDSMLGYERVNTMWRRADLV